MKKAALLLMAAAALLARPVAAHEPIAPGAKVTVVFDQALPNVPGKSMRTGVRTRRRIAVASSP